MTRTGLAFGALIALCGLLWLMVIWPVPTAPQSVESPTQADRPQAGAPALPDAVPRRAAAPAPPPRAAPVVASPEPEPEAEPEPAKAPEVRPTYSPTNDAFSAPLGPIEEFKQAYASEPRDSGASNVEKIVSDAFGPEQAGTKMLRSVLCRQTVCRLELHWNPTNLGQYVAAMGRMSPYFEHQRIGSAPLGAPADDNTRGVEIYLKRSEPPK